MTGSDVRSKGHEAGNNGYGLFVTPVATYMYYLYRYIGSTCAVLQSGPSLKPVPFAKSTRVLYKNLKLDLPCFYLAAGKLGS